MIALMGDAELDEGNVFEALLEGWKHDVRSLWWIIDYNRQSLDGVINMFLFQKIEDFFRSVGWNVVTLKYGTRLQKAFEGPAGEALRRWIDDCPNPMYSALTFAGGAAWRDHLKRDLRGTSGVEGVSRLPRRRQPPPPDDQPRRPRHEERSGSIRGRSEDDTPQCFHRLHDQGPRSAICGPQGQSRRSHESGTDAALPRGQQRRGRSRMGALRGPGTESGRDDRISEHGAPTATFAGPARNPRSSPFPRSPCPSPSGRPLRNRSGASSTIWVGAIPTRPTAS